MSKLEEIKAKVRDKAKKSWTWIKDHKWEILGSLLVVSSEAAIGYGCYKLGEESGVKNLTDALYGLEDKHMSSTYYPDDGRDRVMNIMPTLITKSELERGISSTRLVPGAKLTMADLMSMTSSESSRYFGDENADKQELRSMNVYFYTRPEKQEGAANGRQE